MYKVCLFDCTSEIVSDVLHITVVLAEVEHVLLAQQDSEYENLLTLASHYCPKASFWHL